MNIKEKGALGEDIAEAYLIKKGYKILERNFRFGKHAEIDIIALDNETLVFIEVKTRTSFSNGFGREAVNRVKQKNIRLAANYYIMKNKQSERYCRFDVVEITSSNGQTDIDLLQNAF